MFEETGSDAARVPEFENHSCVKTVSSLLQTTLSAATVPDNFTTLVIEVIVPDSSESKKNLCEAIAIRKLNRHYIARLRYAQTLIKLKRCLILFEISTWGTPWSFENLLVSIGYLLQMRSYCNNSQGFISPGTAVFNLYVMKNTHNKLKVDFKRALAAYCNRLATPTKLIAWGRGSEWFETALQMSPVTPFTGMKISARNVIIDSYSCNYLAGLDLSLNRFMNIFQTIFTFQKRLKWRTVCDVSKQRRKPFVTIVKVKWFRLGAYALVSRTPRHS